jgi:hypothetical protein
MPTKPTGPVTLANTSLTSGIVACWPLNEGSGTTARDIVGGAVLNCSGAGVSWNTSPLGLITVGPGSRASVATPSYLKLYPSSQPAISILWFGTVAGSYSGSLPGVAGVAESSGQLNDYVIALDPTNFTYGIGGANGEIGNFPATSGNTYNVVFLQSAGNLTPYVNNVGDAGKSINLPSGISYGATSEVFLGAFPGGSDSTNLLHQLFVIWARALTEAEVGELNSNPFQILASAPANGASLLMHL